MWVLTHNLGAKRQWAQIHVVLPTAQLSSASGGKVKASLALLDKLEMEWSWMEQDVAARQIPKTFVCSPVYFITSSNVHFHHLRYMYTDVCAYPMPNKNLFSVLTSVSQVLYMFDESSQWFISSNDIWITNQRNY